MSIVQYKLKKFHKSIWDRNTKIPYAKTDKSN